MFLPISIHAEIVALAHRRNSCSIHDRRKRLLVNFGKFAVMMKKVVYNHRGKCCIRICPSYNIITLFICIYNLEKSRDFDNTGMAWMM